MKASDIEKQWSEDMVRRGILCEHEWIYPEDNDWEKCCKKCGEGKIERNF